MTITFADMIGKTCISVTEDGSEVTFRTAEGDEHALYHQQDCCEHVRIEEIIGELSVLEGSPITKFDEVTGDEAQPENFDPKGHDSVTWTLYTIATEKGEVKIRWLGESNGYYSESVDFR